MKLKTDHPEPLRALRNDGGQSNNRHGDIVVMLLISPFSLPNPNAMAIHTNGEKGRGEPDRWRAERLRSIRS